MSSKRIEHQIDDALLATAVGAGFIYARRRTRRLLDRVFLGGAVIAGMGTVGMAGAVAAWYRHRASAAASASAGPSRHSD